MKKLILTVGLILSTASAFAATAIWTGEQEFVTTVTYQPGVRCGYNYLGQHFYRVFVGSSCPASIEVE